MHAGVSLSAKRKREQVRQRYPASENEYPEHYRAHYAFLRSLTTFAVFTRLAQSEGWFLQQASSAGDGQHPIIGIFLGGEFSKVVHGTIRPCYLHAPNFPLSHRQ
jgi:hypothetical protein